MLVAVDGQRAVDETAVLEQFQVLPSPLIVAVERVVRRGKVFFAHVQVQMDSLASLRAALPAATQTGA